jgi:hypothetical protein
VRFPEIDAIGERKYTPVELAERYNLHRTTVTKLFQNEPGVLRLGHAARNGKRQHYTLRIPESVALRVLGRLIVR